MRSKAPHKHVFLQTRKYVSRREVADLTGISIPALGAMAREKRGPVCRIPAGFSVNMYYLEDVHAWLSGEQIPAWSDTAAPRRTRRGRHLLSNPGPGRPRKKPKTKKTAAHDNASGEGGAK